MLESPLVTRKRPFPSVLVCGACNLFHIILRRLGDAIVLSAKDGARGTSDMSLFSPRQFFVGRVVFLDLAQSPFIILAAWWV
jgi:hypothetical protein